MSVRPLELDGKVVGAICGPSGWEIIRDESIGEHWCFKCRKRRDFRFIVGRDPDWENDYYGPSAHVECSVCNTVDGDCGFGSSREYSDDE